MDVLLLLLKASLLLSLTLLATRLLYRTAAVTRHQLWTLTFGSLLALPLLSSVLPAMPVPVPDTLHQSVDAGDRRAADRPSEVSPTPQGTIVHDGTLLSRVSPVTAQPERPRSSTVATRWSIAAAPLVVAWMMGAIAAVAALVRSLLRARRVSRDADRVVDPEWQRAAGALGARLGLRRPARLLVSAAVATPMAGGIWRPVIFLPASARLWSPEHRDVVLAHEIAHLAGRDPLRHLLARLAVAFYWFHPLAWIAARQATVAREQACDETVLALGTRPSAYARVLLDLAESMHAPAPALGALPMVQHSLLETRLMAILKDDARPVTRRRVFIPAVAVTLLTLSVAAAQPAARASAPILPLAGATTTPAPVPLTPADTTLDANVAAIPVSVAARQPDLDRDSPCWWNVRSTGIGEQVGTRGRDRVIQKNFGDLQLCMVAEEAGDRNDAERPSQWLGNARRVVMEARRGNVLQRLVVERQAAGGSRTSWRVGAAERAFDAAAHDGATACSPCSTPPGSLRRCVAR